MQAQLTIGATDDPLEREADQVAEAVTGVPAPAPAPASDTGAPPNGDGGDEGDGQGQAGDELSADGTMQRTVTGGDGDPAGGWRGHVGDSLSRSGRPIADGDRAPLEQRFGVDLGDVRVHDDGPADRAARAVGARAFTVGDDVVFRSGEYQTGSPEGRRLLAHELTHVVQQRGQHGSGGPGVAGSDPARLQRNGDPKAKPASRSTEPLLTFTITPPRVMTGTEFRVWVNMQILGVDQKTAEHYAAVNRWWGDLATKGVTAAQVGKPTPFTFEADLYRRHRYAGSLPKPIQDALGIGKIDPKDHPQAVRIANKLTPAEWADYLARVTARTTDLDVLEASVNRYLEWKRKRAAEAERYKELHTKLLGTESLLKQYREYRKLQHKATHGTPVGAARGSMMVIPPTQSDVDAAEAARKSLTDALVAAGFKGGIPDFELAIKEFVTSFEAQAMAVAMDALDYYESFLFKQGELYQSDEFVGKLYDSLAPYRAAYADLEVVSVAARKAESRAAEPSRRPGQGGVRSAKADKEQADAQAAEKAQQEKVVGTVRAIEGQHPIFGEQHLPVSRRINKPALAKADKAGLKALLAQHIADRTTDVRNTRGNLRQDPELIYKLGNVVDQAKAKLEVAPNSIFAELIKERTDAIQRSETLIAALKAVLAIAFMIMTLGSGAIVVFGALGLFGLGSLGVYEEYEKLRIASSAAGSGLSPNEPSPVWLVLSVVGVAFDAAAVVKAVGALRGAALVLEAGGSVDDFRKAVRTAESTGLIDSKVALSVEAAAGARQLGTDAATELATALGKASTLSKPMSDPAVYQATVKMASAKLQQGVDSATQFVAELNAVRTQAKLGNLAGEELALAKQAWNEARTSAPARTELLGSLGQSRAGLAKGGIKYENISDFWPANQVTSTTATGRVTTGTVIKKTATTTVDFKGLETLGGGRVWVTKEGISVRHVDDMVKQVVPGGSLAKGTRKVHVVTGRHGPGDVLVRDKDFYRSDIANVAISSKDVEFHDFYALKEADLRRLLEGGDEVVIAWCSSEETKSIARILVGPLW